MITSNLFLYYKITIPTLKLKNVRHEYMFPRKGNKMVQLLILVGKVQNKATLKSYFTCPCRKNNPKAWWKTVCEAYGAPHLQVKYKLEWLKRGKVGTTIFANLQIHVSFGLAMSFLGIYPRLRMTMENSVLKKAGTNIFLFIYK